MEKKFAKFYKCALQVNPYSYSSYRGQIHNMTEDEYNKSIYDYCIQEDISIIGLADHGNVSNSENLRNFLTSRGLLVFPGFEISTSEKIHIVCLFSENTTIDQLERYLGELGLTDPDDGTTPSTMNLNQITKKIAEKNGFWYAAHITNDNGILKSKADNLWKLDSLIAAQIPANYDENNYKNILKNKDPNYKKDIPFALINSKDINTPDDLSDTTASCLIKLSSLNFESFKLAFKDPQARVKLNSDIKEKYPHSSIDSINIHMGYLDELSLELSPNLNTVIGGRGTGKSTLIELIRYCLDKTPLGEESQKTFNKICQYNLGSGGKIELTVTSNKQYANQFKIIKRYNENPIIENIDGSISNYTVNDILPNIEIYSQNEIMDIADDDKAKVRILDRFLDENADFEIQKQELKSKLQKNSESLLSKYQEYKDKQELIAQLPVLQEKQKQFDTLGISQKLDLHGKLLSEEQKLNNIKQKLAENDITVNTVNTHINSEFLNKIHHQNIFGAIKNQISSYNDKLKKLYTDFETLKSDIQSEINSIFTQWENDKLLIENDVNKAIKSLKDTQGKSKEQILSDYTANIKKISQIEPLESITTNLNESITDLEDNRKQLKEQLKKIYDSELDTLHKTVKYLNKKALNKKVEIELSPFSNKDYIIEFLQYENGLGESSLKWIKTCEDFNLSNFVQSIRQGKEKLLSNYTSYGLTNSKAETLCNISQKRLYELEIIDIPHIINIKLNIGTYEKPKFKNLNELSKGQQCTAILNILMLQNNDPLLVDQPEDNLDNSFIANNLVDGIRNLKINRQFMFATHNANIPVFGDAELIILMNTSDAQGEINSNSLGSIDNSNVKEGVIKTLEGGHSAFKMRKAKYNL